MIQFLYHVNIQKITEFSSLLVAAYVDNRNSTPLYVMMLPLLAGHYSLYQDSSKCVRNRN